MVICQFCNKEYKTYQSRSNHIKKYHENENIQPPKSSNNSPPIPPISAKNTTSIVKSELDLIHQNDVNLICKFCNKKFTRSDNLLRHQNERCKKRFPDDNEKIKQENLELKNIIKSQTEQINEIKSMLLEIMNKKAKVHPKTLH